MPLPVNLAMTVGSGIANEASAVWDGLTNSDTVAGGAVSAVGGALSSAGSFIASLLSDGRLKENIAPITDALSRL
jgi:hypothetical protein